MGGMLVGLTADGANDAGMAPPGYLWSLLQMLGALLLVCLIAYLLLRGLRRVLVRPAPAGAVRVLERCPLSPRHSLWIVEVGGHCLLLGSSDAPGGAVTRLAELDPQALPPGLPDGARRGALRSFREILSGLGGRPPGSQP